MVVQSVLTYVGQKSLGHMPIETKQGACEKLKLVLTSTQISRHGGELYCLSQQTAEAGGMKICTNYVLW